MVATSKAVAIILDLAMQSTLGDVFSEIALTLGRPYVIGGWIILSDDVEGHVVESNWRSIHILTGSNNLVVLPNSVLARLGLTSVSRPDESHLLTLTVRVAPTQVPSMVVEVTQSVLLGCTILSESRRLPLHSRAWMRWRWRSGCSSAWSILPSGLRRGVRWLTWYTVTANRLALRWRCRQAQCWP